MELLSTIKQVFNHVYISYKDVWAVWLGFLSKFIENFTSKCLLAILLGKLIVALVEGDHGYANTIILITCGVLIATAVMNSIGDHLFVKYTDEKYKVLAGRFHGQLLAKDIDYFERENPGKLNTLFRNHLDGTIKVIRLMRGNIFSFLASFWFPIFAVAFYNLKIAAAVFVIAIIELLVTYLTAKKVKTQRKEALKVYHKLSGEVADQLKNIEIVKASGREDFFKQTVTDLAATEESLFTSRHKFEALAEFIKGTIVAAGLGFTVWLITAQSESTQQTTELSVISILYLLQINLAISSFPDLFKSFFEHIETVASTLSVLSIKEESFHYDSSATVQIHLANVVFDGVGYTYRVGSDSARRVFENFSLDVKAGTHCAVMGESGVGKSTIAHLLLRFDDVTKGTILIGGADLRDYDIKHLRESISYVPSQPSLFHRTLRENIVLYSPNATTEEIVLACQCAQIHEFISHLPNGYETEVGERSGNLSSGQKQRIAIARALLKMEAKIFIFDEITSALDEGAADNLVDRIRERLSGKTVFFMTHNADLADKMDFKVVI